MNFEVAHHKGKVYLTFKDPQLLAVVMRDVKELIKSAVYNCNFETAKGYIDLLLALRMAKKEMEGEE